MKSNSNNKGFKSLLLFLSGSVIVISVIIFQNYFEDTINVSPLIVNMIFSAGAGLIIERLGLLWKGNKEVARLVIGLAGGILSFLTNVPHRLIENTTITVSVRPKNNPQGILLRNQGNVMMDIEGDNAVNSERRLEQINEKGVAIFSNVPVGKLVRFNVDYSEPYKSISPDSLYRIKSNQKIELIVELEGLEKISGQVRSNDLPLSGALVYIGDLRDTTDDLGNFTINVPEELRRKTQFVNAFKPGYDMQEKPFFPETQGRLIFNLMPLR